MSVLSQRKYQTLVDKLYQLTTTGNLVWGADLLDDNLLSTQIGTKNVEIGEGRSDSGEPLVRVTIRDETGKALDTFDDESLSGIPVTGGNFGGYWSLMTDLLAHAKRQATGAEDAIDEILSVLDEKIPF
jgi:hypothetical protein